MTTATALKVQNYASPTTVREWAKANNIEVSDTGRIPFLLAKEFNKHNSVKYSAGKHIPTIVVEGRDARNKKVSRKASVALVRHLLASNGETVGKRGPLPEAVIAEALGLKPIERPEPDGTVVFRGEVVKASVAREALIGEGHVLGSRGRIPAHLLG